MSADLDASALNIMYNPGGTGGTPESLQERSIGCLTHQSAFLARI